MDKTIELINITAIHCLSLLIQNYCKSLINVYVAYNFVPAPHNLRQSIIQQVVWLNSEFGIWYTNLQAVCTCECKARVTR